MSAPEPKGWPIWIPCEGSGCSPCGQSADVENVGMCAMCGGLIFMSDGKVENHDRDDILARIDRGDFG